MKELNDNDDPFQPLGLAAARLTDKLEEQRPDDEGETKPRDEVEQAARAQRFVETRLREIERFERRIETIDPEGKRMISAVRIGIASPRRESRQMHQNAPVRVLTARFFELNMIMLHSSMEKTMDVIDPHGAAEIFFDGIHEVKIVQGVVRIALFSRQDGTGIIVARLALPLSELADAIQALVIALTEAAKNSAP
jgi:hypothetical protein